MITQSRATMQDAAELAAIMREDDRREVAALGLDPRSALEMCIRASGDEAWALRADGEIMAVWGVSPVCTLTGLFMPWSLTGPAVDKHRKAFLRRSRMTVMQLRLQYPEMINMVDARYVKSLRWLARLGFEISPAEPCGPYGLPFHKITMRGA